ncbi:hypothetical protein [Carnobacterium iners]|uniref:hypothetical protein n=1 Tax=Carnobacterium iners TaxID=1073423 RepID=UPI000A1C7E90|nr:hypothetical protein [Carnobacterium iners]
MFLNNYLLNTYKLEVYDNISFNKIIVESGKKLTIDPMGGNHTILVNDLSISSGNIDIVGKGTITFLVNNLSISSGRLNVVEEGKITFLVNNLIFTSSNLDIIGKGIIRLVVASTINFNQNSYINASGTSKQFLLIFTGPNPNFTNINMMNANVISIGNEKPVDLNNTTINGVFLTDNKEIILSGGNWNRPSNVILIAPKSAVTLTGSYLMNGSVISDTFEINGSAKLIYKAIDTTGFPFGSSVTVTDPKPEDIINSGTIIEN